MMETVVIGLAGTGWAGAMHASGYRKVYGIECRLKTVCSLEADREKFADRYGFEHSRTVLRSCLTTRRFRLSILQRRRLSTAG